MSRILLVHWNEVEADERAEALRLAEHNVRIHFRPQGEGLREVRDDPPEAVVIDLSRLPSHGRAVATWMRGTKALRGVPVVFVGGEREKVATTKRLLPDAVYAEWRTIRSAVRRAITHPPKVPVVPGTMAGYSGTPLPKKLGIRAGATVSLRGASRGFEKVLGELPAGARVRRGGRGTSDVVLLFVRKRADLSREFETAARAVAPRGVFWIVWPKKTSAIASPGLGQAEIRAHGLARKWVDYKICAVDATWSALAFARRKGQVT